MRANRKRDDNVTINDEQNAVFFGDVQIEDLVTMPENTSEFVTVQRSVPPFAEKSANFARAARLISGGRFRNSLLNPTVRR